MFSWLDNHSIGRNFLSITILVSLFSSHYYINRLSDPVFYEFEKLLLISLSTIGYCGGAFLYIHAEKDRSKKIFAIQLILIAIAASLTLSFLYRNGRFNSREILTPLGIIYGCFYAFMMALYPIEVLRPNWLNLRRVLLFAMPIPIFGIIAWGYTRFYGDILRFLTFRDF